MQRFYTNFINCMLFTQKHFLIFFPYQLWRVAAKKIKYFYVISDTILIFLLLIFCLFLTHPVKSRWNAVNEEENNIEIKHLNILFLKKIIEECNWRYRHFIMEFWCFLMIWFYINLHFVDARKSNIIQNY